MKLQRWIGSVLVPMIAVGSTAACYTVSTPAEVKQPRSVAVGADLRAMIVEHVEDALYTYPQVATRAGMHVYELASGESLRLDRELPNYSTEVVEARIQSLERFLERAEADLPESALSHQERVDKMILVDAIRLELHHLSDGKVHTRNPVFHVADLAEAMYYPTVVEYAPEEVRLADVVARLHWLPAYVDRTIRMLESSSAAHTEAAAGINRWIVDFVKKDLSELVDGRGDLEESYDGMSGPILDSLRKLGRFLEDDLPEKSKRTWRLGTERYEDLFALSFHGIADPEGATASAKERVDALLAEMFELARPVYCERNETDRDVCGPTEAEIEAARRAEEAKRAREEAKRAREEAKRAREEAKRAREEAKRAREEERRLEREEAKRAREEERERKRREKEEKKRKEKEEKEKPSKKYENPYADEPEEKEEKKEKKGGIVNPYGMIYEGPPEARGAKTAGDEGDSEEGGGGDEGEVTKEAGEEEAEKAEEADGKAEEKDEGEGDEGEERDGDDAVDGTAVGKVVGFAVRLLAERRKPAPDVAWVETRIREIARLAEDRGLVDAADVDGVEVETTPAFLRDQGYSVALLPPPVFQPTLRGRLFVPPPSSGEMPAGPMADVALSRASSPGRLEVFERAAAVDPQTRGALRAIYADPAFVEGWALMAALSAADGDGEEDRLMRLAGLAEELLAAVCVLVDVKLHTTGMSEEEARDLLEERAFVEESVADRLLEVTRLFPTRLCAAFVGLVGWREASARVEEALGEAFDPKEFYRRALAQGPVPLGSLADLLLDPSAEESPEPEPVGPSEPEKTSFTVIDALKP